MGIEHVEPLPSWVDPVRLQSQQHIVTDIVDRFKGHNGHPKNDVVFLQGPTGVGKTLIAELVRRQMKAKTIYSCTTKNLQDQFIRDFPYAKVLKGRSNYLTTLGMVDELGNEVDNIDKAVTAVDCTFTPETRCSWCDNRAECPYIRARGRATTAPLAVLNTSYLITDAIGPQRFTRRDLYVLDEADVLEDELLNHAQLHLSNYRMKKLGINPPKFKTKSETWAEWIHTHALEQAGKYYESLPEIHEAKDLHTIREIKYMERLIDNLGRVAMQLPKGRWVHDGYSERNYDAGDVIFRPVYITGYGDELVWKNGRKFLLMSATILASTVMAAELGINLQKGRRYDLVDVPSVFPPENRPIHVVPVADMTYDKMDESKPRMAKAINGVLNRHKDERILVHCVSYDLARYLHQALRDPLPSSGIDEHDRLLLVYYNSREKDAVLEEYKRNPSAVLFAPSMDRGVDLPDDLCRVQVIAKIPYPALGDKRINTRLHSPGGQSWYIMHTIRTIVQMAGRAVRHREDYAITYMLDEQFTENIWKNNSRMFPRYFREALNFRFNPRLLTER